MYDNVLHRESGYSKLLTPFREKSGKSNSSLPRVSQGIHIVREQDMETMYSLILSALQSNPGNALIIDCLSVTNPYRIVQLCRKKGLDFNEYMDRILIERPFTAYQMTSVVSELLSKWIKENNISVVAGVGIFSLLLDPDINEMHRKWGKRLVTRRLEILTQHFNLTTLIHLLNGKTIPYFPNIGARK